jgi:lipopolysaccharide transport system permease protein
MVGYFARIWGCRHFWMSLVRMDLRTRYRRSVLGIGWSLLHPLAMAGILTLVFHQILGVDIYDYAPYLLTGLACWSFLTATAVGGGLAFFQNESYIRQCPLPLAIYPLRTVLSASFHLLVTLGAVLAVVAGLRGLAVGPHLLHLVPAVVLLFLLGWALATLSALATVHFQDMQHLMDLGFQMLFYATPIIYTDKAVRERGLGWLIDLNPFASVLALVRDPVMNGTAPGLTTYLIAGGLVGGVCALTVFATSRLQDRLIFHL